MLLSVIAEETALIGMCLQPCQRLASRWIDMLALCLFFPTQAADGTRNAMANLFLLSDDLLQVLILQDLKHCYNP